MFEYQLGEVRIGVMKLCFVLGGWPVAQWFEQPFCVEPAHPLEGGVFDVLEALLRQYFPKGTDLSAISINDLNAVALTLNSRPRKTLGWRTPAETLNQFLQLHLAAGVATTR